MQNYETRKNDETWTSDRERGIKKTDESSVPLKIGKNRKILEVRLMEYKKIF
ncbi:MAG: hypothetical protein AAGI90_00020 [Chlamydiota bacterium]